MTEAALPGSLRNLVLFMIALALLGTILGLAGSFFITHHMTGFAPLNGCWGLRC
jgi:hypothetical protein